MQPGSGYHRSGSWKYRVWSAPSPVRTGDTCTVHVHVDRRTSLSHPLATGGPPVPYRPDSPRRSFEHFYRDLMLQADSPCGTTAHAEQRAMTIFRVRAVATKPDK